MSNRTKLNTRHLKEIRDKDSRYASKTNGTIEAPKEDINSEWNTIKIGGGEVTNEVVGKINIDLMEKRRTMKVTEVYGEERTVIFTLYKEKSAVL